MREGVAEDGNKQERLGDKAVRNTLNVYMKWSKNKI